LTFIRYGAQAIVKDEFSKCFAQRPRNNYLSLDVFVRYLILFPIRLVWIGFASFVFIVLLPLAAPLGISNVCVTNIESDIFLLQSIPLIVGCPNHLSF
jgi:hypothetical protein